MFKKFARNLLQDLSDKIEIEAYCCKNEEDRKLYLSVIERIAGVIAQLPVEKKANKSLKQ